MSKAERERRNHESLAEYERRANALRNLPRPTGNIVMHQPAMARRVSAERLALPDHVAK